MEAGSSSRGRKKKVPSFLTKCEAMVDDPSTDSIISWRETGGGFVIRSDFEFEKHVLPKYFKHGNFQSFCRQLQEYGFRKIYTNTDRREYANKSFLKGRKDLLSSITRSESIQTTPMSNTKGIATSQAQKVGSCDFQLEAAKQIYYDGIRNEVCKLSGHYNAIKKDLCNFRLYYNNAEVEANSLNQRYQATVECEQQLLSLLKFQSAELKENK